MVDLSRRTLIKATAALGAAVVPATFSVEGAKARSQDTGPTTADAPSVGSPVAGASPPINSLFFNSEEAAFIEAAVARLIPADQEWPGALEAGVHNYIDKQLAGAWGAGERLYRSGPWQPGAQPGLSASPHAGGTVPYCAHRHQQAVGAYPVRVDERR